MPRLSVLMPAYNAAATVDRAARSTLRALPLDSELVVLDDGSTDKTSEILEGIGDPRIRVLQRANKGVAASLNDLLGCTDSAFVARMDADDLCLPRRFARQLSALEDADVVFTSVRPWNGVDRPRRTTSRGLSTTEFPFHLLLTNPVAHSSMAAHRKVITGTGGYRVVPSEDYDLWLRLARAGMRMRRLPLPGLAYRTHRGQVTADDSWRLRSWQDPLIAEAFSALSERLIGLPAQRITTLSVAALEPAERVRRLREFGDAVRTAAGSLPAPARRRLNRRLAERERWLHHELMRSDTPAHHTHGRTP